MDYNDVNIYQISDFQVIMEKVERLIDEKQPIKFICGPKFYMKYYNFLSSATIKNELTPQQITQFLGDRFKGFIDQYIIPALESQECTDQFIIKYMDCLANYKTYVRWVTQLFNFYEQSSQQMQNNIASISIKELQKNLMQRNTFKDLWLSAFNDQINKFRDKIIVQVEKLHVLISVYIQNQSKFKSIIMYSLVIKGKIQITEQTNGLEYSVKQFYSKDLFQQYYLTFNNYVKDSLLIQTKNYYSHKVKIWQDLPYKKYVLLANAQLKIEIILASKYFTNFMQEYMELIYKEIFSISIPQDQIDQIFDDIQINYLNKSSQIDQNILNEIYQLYLPQTNDQMEIIAQYFKNYISCKGQNICDDKQNNPDLKVIKQRISQFDLIFQFNDFCQYVLVSQFNCDQKFKNIYEQVFNSILSNISDCSKRLAFYYNINLRDILKEGRDNDAQFIWFSENATKIAEFLNEKDTFFFHYHYFLKDRVFKNQIKNYYYEEKTIQTLKKVHNEHFLLDIQQLWMDYNKSQNIYRKEILLKLKEVYPLTKLEESSQFVVLRKTNHLYEFDEKQSIFAPTELKNILELANQTYQQKNKANQFLIWNLRLGASTLSFRVAAGLFILRVSNIQLCILLYLKEFKEINTLELIKLTNLPQSELVYQMQELFTAEVIRMVNDTSPDSSITLNNEMPKRGSKHLYDLVPKKKFGDERVKEQFWAEEQQFITNSRDYRIKTTIVRLMKSRKEMLYVDILACVQKELKGYIKFTNKDIIQVIDYLIEEEYITRDQINQSKFIYSPAG